MRRCSADPGEELDALFGLTEASSPLSSQLNRKDLILNALCVYLIFYTPGPDP